MPRGPGKKENYNLSYDRFNSIDIDDETKGDEADAAGGVAPPQPPGPAEGMPDIRDMLRGMPVELQEAYHLMSIAKANGDEKAQQRASELALAAVSKGTPEVRAEFLKNIEKEMPSAAAQLEKEFAKPSVATQDSKEMLGRLQDEAVRVQLTKEQQKAEGQQFANLKTQMEEGQKTAALEMENLRKKQEELENIRSPEEFMKFMQADGITQEDIQRIMSGDAEHMQSRFNETIQKQMTKDTEKTTNDSTDALKQVEHIHSTLFGTEPEEPPAEAVEEKKKPKRRPAAPPEPEVLIPMYRLQYTKDDKGNYATVELKCTLPGVADMSAINLDVSEKHLRLSTMDPHPRYAVNSGPFPVLIEPGMARAKYSKKREELSISVPAKVVD